MNLPHILSVIPLNKYLRGGSAFRNVAQMALGNVIAQAITVVIVPLLTRLYTPEAIGTFSLLLSITTLLNIAVNGRYELAIIIAEDKAELIRLMIGNILLIGIMSIVYSFGIIVLYFTKLVDFSQLGTLIWLIIPFTVLLGLQKIARAYLNYYKIYRNITQATIAWSAVTAVFQIFLGTVAGTYLSLAAGRMLGEISYFFLIWRKLFEDRALFIEHFNLREIRATLYKYREFPKFSIASELLNKGATASLPILIFALFGPVVTGYYALSLRVLLIPTSFLIEPTRDVLFRSYAERFRKGISLAPLLLKSTTIMFAIIAPPTILLSLLFPQITVPLFGPEWAGAVFYMQVLLPMAIFQLVIGSTAMSLYVMQKQRFMLVYAFLQFLTSLIAIVVGAFLSSPEVMIIGVSLSSVIMYVVQFMYNFIMARRHPV